MASNPPDRLPGFIFRTPDFREGNAGYELRFPTDDGRTLTIRMGPGTLEFFREQLALRLTPTE